MRDRLNLLTALSAVVLLAACGTPGAPRPPSLDLPRPVEDLAAARKGDHVYLDWTPPRETTDQENIRRRGPTRVCRVANEFPVIGCAQVVGEVAPPPSEQRPPQSPAQRADFTDTLPLELERRSPAGSATYAVEVLNTRGRSAGLSNQVQVPLAPTLPPPTDLKAEVTNDGIILTFSGAEHEHEIPRLRHRYRVYRRTDNSGPLTVIAEVALLRDPGASIVDRSFEWEKTYSYWVTAVTALAPEQENASKNGAGHPTEVEGDDSPAIRVFAHDVFPPAVPAGLQAVFSGVGQKPFIDLTWAPSTESDLAGYNVYRHEAGAAVVRINRDLVKAPAFRDDQVQPGRQYAYAVTAVDLRGNESPRSEETSEKFP